MNRVNQISELYDVYAKRLGKIKLNAEEFQPLVLNIAYLEIAKAKKNNIPYDTRKLFIEYTQAAIIAIPEYKKEVDDPRYSTMYFGFAATAEWDGLWNFLREYFESKLGIKIDNESRKSLRYDSSVHNRYENGKLITSSNAHRKVSINLSQDMKNAQFSISETLSNKEGNLFSVQGRKYVYLGTDPDFIFEFTLDSFNNIELFSLTRTDKNLKIDYLE
jgi:hypothetical protein